MKDMSQRDFDQIVSNKQENNLRYEFPYDYNSITHLSAKRFSKNDLPTIEPKVS